jgi:hypothetical protein
VVAAGGLAGIATEVGAARTGAGDASVLFDAVIVAGVVEAAGATDPPCVGVFCDEAQETVDGSADPLAFAAVAAAEGEGGA